MRLSLTVLLSLLLGAPLAASATFGFPRTFHVDCSQSTPTITQVLRFADDGDTIQVTGDCTETLTIEKAITLDGGGTASLAPADPADSTITVPRTQGVTIRGFSLEAPAFFQVFVYGGANVTVDSSVIRNAARFGISAATNSVVTVRSNTIMDNALGGMIALSGAQYSIGFRLFFDPPSPNLIANNNQFGVVLAGQGGARILLGNTISGHNIGVLVVEGGQARIAGNVIEANNIGILADSGAMVRLPDTDNVVPAINEPNSGVNNQLGIACGDASMIGVVDGLQPAVALPPTPGALAGSTTGLATFCHDQTETLPSP